ncbi:TPA: hypothetical protein RFV71_000351 [Klebsiella quasipneumoniae subsp. quasipneumoniae]|nr:hypothetical protein [Klebsiella quasipneumoniae subsp. quasipneumoniae]
MQDTRKVIKVFIASPGDLVSERTIAREIGEEFNSLWAESTGYQIEIVGWEETIGKIGRPQEVINRDLSRCELFIGMLWKRWGTAPDTCGNFTSGFEEEFSISLERYKKEKIPQISMFFKELDKDLLRDPGPDLQKVIKFKEGLINGKEILYETFTDSKDFERKIRRRISDYVKNLTIIDRETNHPENSNESNSVDGNFKSENDSHNFFSSSTSSFIKEFISNLQCSGLDAVSSERIALFRLIANIINSPLNDDNVLGVHDSNLLYKCANSFTLGQAEVSGLILSGIDNYDSHNTPLWKWINESNVSIENYTLLTKDERKRKAIDIMRFIAHDIKKDRQIYLNDWLIDESNENVKVSALKYIGDVGTLNDIPLIIKEYERNEVRTSSSAIEAIISISFRHGVIKGFDAVLEYQPSSISSKMLDALKEKEVLLESEKLFEGLNVKNKEVREFCISSLIRRSAINECQLEELLKHDDYDVRYIVINTLSSINYKLYKEKARDVLTKNTGEDKDSIYKKYVKHNLFRESNENLIDLGKTPYIFDADHIIALAKKDNKNITRVREIVSDNAEIFISEILNNIPENNRAEFVKFFNEHGGFVKDNITFDCVEFICETMKKEDLNLIRGYLRSKGSSLSNVIMNFFKKYGDFDDVYNLCNSKMKEKGTLLGAHSIGQYKNKILADTVLFLSKGKESELLEINMPDMLKINIVSQMNPNGFKEIPHHKIFDFLNKENTLLRERVCLKVVESMTKDQISMILSDYSKQITYYYNVIHWLDFGVNFNKVISRKAIKKYLYS